MKIAVYRRTDDEPLFMGYLKGKNTIVDNAGAVVGTVGVDDFFLDADALVETRTQMRNGSTVIDHRLRRIC